MERLIGEPPRLKQQSLAELDRELLTLFNRSVRRLALNKDGTISCYICGRTVPYERSEAMHFQGRSGRGTRFNRMAVRAGCHDCNAKPLGDRERFAQRLDAEHGPGTAEQLTILSKQVMRFDRAWYAEQIAECERINRENQP